MTGGVRPLFSTAAATPDCSARSVSVSVLELPLPVRAIVPTVHPLAAKKEAVLSHLPWSRDQTSTQDIPVSGGAAACLKGGQLSGPLRVSRRFTRRKVISEKLGPKLHER